MLSSAKEVFGARQARPKRPWISDPTLRLLAQRKEHAAMGDIGQAEAIDKEIKASAKQDKANWLSNGLKDNFWDPVKLLSRKSPAKVVRLKREAKPTLEKPAT
eukprot:402491-Alexandrium_andersonii.AAC.1